MVSENRKNTQHKPYKCPSLLGLARLQNLSSIQKKKPNKQTKRIVFVHSSYTQKKKFENNAIYSHFTNMIYLGEKIVNGCERPAYWKLKTLVREIKDLNKWRNILCVLVRRLSTVKKAVPFKLNCRVNEISIKIPAGVFGEIGKLFLKFRWKCRD